MSGPMRRYWLSIVALLGVVGVELGLARGPGAGLDSELDSELGRLFTTSAEREAMKLEGPALGSLRLDGLARGADGVVAVWLDGRRTAVGEPLAGGGRVVAVEGDRVVVERAGRRRTLRVGERLEGAW